MQGNNNWAWNHYLLWVYGYKRIENCLWHSDRVIFFAVFWANISNCALLRSVC